MSPPKKCYRVPHRACDFSTMTFVIVRVRKKMKASMIFPKVLKGKWYAPAEILLLQIQRSENSWKYLQMHCSSFEAGEESLGQNEVDLSDVCEVFWGDWITLSVCHCTDECAQLLHRGKLLGCCLHTKSTFEIEWSSGKHVSPFCVME